MGSRYDTSRRFREAERRRKLREKAVAYKGGKCAICGYSMDVSAMDFHHVETHLKDFNISSRMTSWEALARELDKTVLLCCRCHREVHDGFHPGYLEDPDVGRREDLGDWDDVFQEGVCPPI